MTETLDRSAILSYGRHLDPDELEQRMIHSEPGMRIELLKHVSSELNRDNLSMRDRAAILDLKCRLNTIHQRMLKVYR